MGFAQRLPSHRIEFAITPAPGIGIGVALDLIEQLNLRQCVVTQARRLQPRAIACTPVESPSDFPI